MVSSLRLLCPIASGISGQIHRRVLALAERNLAARWLSPLALADHCVLAVSDRTSRDDADIQGEQEPVSHLFNWKRVVFPLFALCAVQHRCRRCSLPRARALAAIAQFASATCALATQQQQRDISGHRVVLLTQSLLRDGQTPHHPVFERAPVGTAALHSRRVPSRQ